jgi:hypothetical protein
VTREGTRPGLTTEERQRLKQLERENFELRRTNEITRVSGRNCRPEPALLPTPPNQGAAG